MDAAGRQSASPEEGSDEARSAPSEYLAEFLSAIMRRQYAEALKYCRLILQYEPHNATARGFYPLLRHKLHLESADDEDLQPSSSEESGSAQDTEAGAGGEDSSEGSEAGSGAPEGSHSSLELDSERSLELSAPRTDSGSACWDSEAGTSRSDDADDNGNAPPAAAAAAPPPLSLRHRIASEAADDLENDNTPASAGGAPLSSASAALNSESMSSLRRLRAHFACSIK